jgi:transcriptional regulator with GAF, ATPase, and Fis domain
MAEVQLTDVFVEMADTLVADFDVIDFLQVLAGRSVQLLGVSAAGVLLTDQQGALRVLAASTERTRLLELFQVQTDQGPCLECFHTGRPLSISDIAATADRWPRFATAAAEVGFAAVHTVPLRLREDIIGALNLFDVNPGALDHETLRIAQALADVATIGLLQQRAVHRSEVLTEQLQTALTSRILIEQAKGAIAERRHIDVDDAFTLLRDSARRSNRRLSDLAQAVIDGSEQLPPAGTSPQTAAAPHPREHRDAPA